MRKHRFSNGSNLDLGAIYCIGRNYSEHAKEMDSEIIKDPIVFLKTQQAYFNDGSEIELPSHSDNVHFECELVVVLGNGGRNISEADAMNYVAGFGIGVDLTARDIQNNAKEKGHPWTFAKSFYKSAGVSEIIPIQETNSEYFDIELYQNDILKQKANTSEMEHSIPKLIAYLSKYFLLEAGDCIFTGTPSGVGKISSGDELNIKLLNYTELKLKVL